VRPAACLTIAVLLLPASSALAALEPLPREEQVRAVRTAWIAERTGKLEDARRLYAEAAQTWPDDVYLMDETLGFLERTGRIRPPRPPSVRG
jgi:hypothetical protein